MFTCRFIQNEVSGLQNGKYDFAHVYNFSEWKHFTSRRRLYLQKVYFQRSSNESNLKTRKFCRTEKIFAWKYFVGKIFCHQSRTALMFEFMHKSVRERYSQSFCNNIHVILLSFYFREIDMMKFGSTLCLSSRQGHFDFVHFSVHFEV